MRPPRCRTSPRPVSARPSGPARPRSGPPASPTGMRCGSPAHNHPYPTCPRGPCGRPRPRTTPSLVATGCSIGSGRGMSELFVAEATGVEGFTRVFVLKRLRAELARDKEAVDQFIDEARLQAGLVHSNIVPVFDFGRGGEYFMTQEYMSGRNLARVVEPLRRAHRRRLDPRLRLLHRARDAAGAGLRPRQKARRQPLASSTATSRPATSWCRSGRGEAGRLRHREVEPPRRARPRSEWSRATRTSCRPSRRAAAGGRPQGSVLAGAGALLLPDRPAALYGRQRPGGAVPGRRGPDQGRVRALHQLPAPAAEILGRALALDPAARFQSAAEFAAALASHIVGAEAEATRLMQSLFGEELRRQTNAASTAV